MGASDTLKFIQKFPSNSPEKTKVLRPGRFSGAKRIIFERQLLAFSKMSKESSSVENGYSIAKEAPAPYPTKRENNSFGYHVMRENGTEPPFYTTMWQSDLKGDYYCQGCDTKLFSSSDKFISACGWPSFTKCISDPVNTQSKASGKGMTQLPQDSDVLVYKKDVSFGMERVEVRCKTCDAHLGHVFEEPGWTQQKSPQDSLRYCINSICLLFKPS
jgi:peptide-methionine (R)-S-oxide reductase